VLDSAFFAEFHRETLSLKLLLFVAGSCFGTVVGILIGHLVMADELRERTQLSQAARNHASTHTTAPDPHAQGTPRRQPEAVRKMLKKLGDDIEKNPKDPEGWLRMARFYSRAFKWQKVVHFIERALELKPDDPEILIELASAYLGLRNNDKTLALLRQATEKNPKHEHAAFSLAVVLSELKRYQEALDALNKLDKVVTDKDTKERIRTQRAIIEDKQSKQKK